MRNPGPLIAKLMTIVGAALVALFLSGEGGADQSGPVTHTIFAWPVLKGGEMADLIAYLL